LSEYPGRQGTGNIGMEMGGTMEMITRGTESVLADLGIEDAEEL